MRIDIDVLVDTLRKIDALAHEYHSYSASAAGLNERRRVVDTIHGLVAAATGADASEYPAGDACQEGGQE